MTEILLDEPEVRDLLIGAARENTRYFRERLGDLTHDIIVAAHSALEEWQRVEAVSNLLHHEFRGSGGALAQQIIALTSGKHLTWFQLETVSRLANLPTSEVNKVPLNMVEDLYSDAILLGSEHEAIRGLYNSLKDAYLSHDYEPITLMRDPKNFRPVSYVDDGWTNGSEDMCLMWRDAWSIYPEVKIWNKSQRFKVDCYGAAFRRLAQELSELDAFDHVPMQKTDHDRWQKQQVSFIRDKTFAMFCCLADEEIWPRDSFFVKQRREFLPAVQTYAETLKTRSSVPSELTIGLTS